MSAPIECFDKKSKSGDLNKPEAFRAGHLDPQLIERYDVNGPRYTSYPTAVQFTDNFDEGAFARAVRDSNGAPIPAPLSIYVHVPFCRQLCYYCACNKLITQDKQKAVDYLDL